MASRPLIIATLVGASVGVPYFASHSSNAQHGATTGNAPTQNGVPARMPIAADPARTGSMIPGAPGYTNSGTSTGTRFASADQVFRFDVTKEWVYQNWDRKSTGPTDVGLFSVRVTLVMAPRMTALAGSLTYYFNSQGQVEHISFRGRTGDSTQLVQLVTRTYRLARVASPTGEQVYQVQYDGQVQSELRTRPEPILHSGSPFQSVAVELELARPGSERVLPPRPTGFENIQAANAAAAAAAAASASAEHANGAGESHSGSFFDKFRHATPQEESQVLSKRWPN